LLQIGLDHRRRLGQVLCAADSTRQIGDILVYRDGQRGNAHAVMVIDPERRIAWGSHGWDGNAKELKVEHDTEVEYRLIKDKKDWERWDRKSMDRKCAGVLGNLPMRRLQHVVY
jgi:hypothetical protein